MIRTNDISIGKDKWIQWKFFDPAKEKIFEIDNLLKSTLNFWNNLETVCDSFCCGIDAFDFWPENIRRASENMDKNVLVDNLIQMQIEINDRKERIVCSARLNNLFDKAIFIQLLDHIIVHLSEVGERRS